MIASPILIIGSERPPDWVAKCVSSFGDGWKPLSGEALCEVARVQTLFELGAAGLPPLPEAWREHPEVDASLAKIAKVVGATKAPWAFYCAGFAVPIIREALDRTSLRARAVIVANRPSASASSLPWLTGTLAALHGSRGMERCLLAAGEESDQKAELERWLEGQPPEPRRVIDDSELQGAYPRLTAEVWNLVARAGADSAGFASGEFDREIAERQGQLHSYWRLLCPEVDWQTSAQCQFADGPDGVAFHVFVADRTWRALKFDLNAAQKAPVCVSFVGLPGSVYIRRAEYVYPSGEAVVPTISEGPTAHLDRMEGGICRASIMGARNEVVFSPPAGACQMRIEYLASLGARDRSLSFDALSGKLTQAGIELKQVSEELGAAKQSFQRGSP